MFVLCPHCEFLVGVDARTGQPPVACPKCGQALEVAPAAEEAPAVEPVAEARPDIEAPERASAPAQEIPPEPAAPKFDADALIAAMSAKPRKTRAKPRTETKPAPKPDAPARRKRTDRTPPAPVPPTPEPAPAVARVATPSIAARLATWWSSRKAARPAPSAEPPQAPPTTEPKRKASVRPIPSLRDRANDRAAKHAARPVSEIEALSIGEAPMSPPPEVEASVAPPAAAPAELPVVAPEVASPVVEATTIEQRVVEPDVIEPDVVEPDVVEASVESPLVEAPAIATPVEPPRVEAPAIATPVEPPRVEAPAIATPVEPLRVDAPPVALPPPEPRLPSPRPAIAPSFLRARAATAASTVSWRQFAAIGGLSLLLALQLLLAQRDALAADARWRPTVDALCTVVRCAMPAWREPDAFTMLSRDVRPHARAPGTLQIDASFRNDARWAQPWPRLWVTLSDIDGRVVGARAFTAAEYLGAPPTQNTLAPGQAAAVRLAVVEPAPDVVAFSFEFR